MLDSPFEFPDGDQYQIYIEADGPGMFRVTDSAHTLMHMSYSMDVDSLVREGRRRDSFYSILSQHDVEIDEGELYKSIPVEELAAEIVVFAQCLTRVFEISTQTREYIAGTFYEDLESEIFDSVTESQVERDYVFSDIANAEDYQVDYRITGEAGRGLLLFGVPNRDKAQVATIILQHLAANGLSDDSLVVVSDSYSEFGKAIFNRLLNASGGLATLSEREQLRSKIQRKIS